MDKFKTVVVPWDFSEHSQTTLNYALENYSSLGVRVICVLEQPNAYEMGWGGEERERKAIESCIADFFATAEHAHETGLQFITEFGDPADEIVRFARNQNADVIVLSTHGRTGLQQLFMGSVAQKVIGKANCPVLVLPVKWTESNSKLDGKTIESRTE